MVCVTFDVDLMDYRTASSFDDLEPAIATIDRLLSQFPQLRTTWFLRMDRHVEKMFGDSTYIVSTHRAWLDCLQRGGHELAWHHHAYRHASDGWVAQSDEQVLLEQLTIYGSIARSLGMSSVRMGWGQQTPATIACLEQLGFRVDSSAIPRPNYPWDRIPLRDWSSTGLEPYRPCRADHRVSGEAELGIIELPIATAELQLPTDTLPKVVRYLNPAYLTKRFDTAYSNWKQKYVETDGLQNTPGVMVTVTHPYEILHGECSGALAFEYGAFASNIDQLIDDGAVFLTVSDGARAWAAAN